MILASIWKYFKRSLSIRPFWIVFPNQLKLLPQRKWIAVQLRNGPKFMVRPNTRDLNEVLAVGLGYEYPSFILDIIQETEDWTLIDAGAHIGTFAVFAAQRKQRCAIVSVEPEKGNCALLRENLRINGLEQRVSVIEGAVTPYDGQFLLELCAENNSHHIQRQAETKCQTQATGGLSLATIIKRCGARGNIGIKLDIEGAEYDVLSSAPDTIRKARFVLMEWHSSEASKQQRWRWLEDYFHGLGFTGTKLSESPWGGVAVWTRVTAD